MKTVEVVAGIIMFEGKILCVQRPENKFPYISKKFEFPGGKIEDKESQKEALARELREELNISTDIKELYLTVNHAYPDFNIIMHSFICLAHSNEIHLNEHIAYEWLTVSELEFLDWAEADVPIVNKLINNG